MLLLMDDIISIFDIIMYYVIFSKNYIYICICNMCLLDKINNKLIKLIN